MTIDTFLEKLKESKSCINWYLAGYPAEGMIRGRDSTNHMYCPVTAVHFMKTGEKLLPPDASLLCTKYGYPATVIWAADIMAPSNIYSGLRASLLDILKDEVNEV